MGGKKETFWYLVFADVLHTILLIAFFFIFKKAVKNKGSVIEGANKSH